MFFDNDIKTDIMNGVALWVKETQTFILATHSTELKIYQLREARQLLLAEGDE